MNRRQRIHSAEIRRLDHIARSLDSIGNALMSLHETIVSGNGNRIIEIGGDIKDNASLQQSDEGTKTMIQQNSGGDNQQGERNIGGISNNSMATIGNDSQISKDNDRIRVGKGIGKSSGTADMNIL